MTFQNSIGQATETSNPVALSERELEVVAWTSHGKTSKEIAVIMDLSDYTVKAHISRARFKLDCVNRAQLVGTALRLGLIP